MEVLIIVTSYAKISTWIADDSEGEDQMTNLVEEMSFQHKIFNVQVYAEPDGTKLH